MKNKYQINEELNNQRLDKAVRVLDKEMSRVMCQKLIDEGHILVNRQKTKIFIQSKCTETKLR